MVEQYEGTPCITASGKYSQTTTKFPLLCTVRMVLSPNKNTIKQKRTVSVKILYMYA